MLREDGRKFDEERKIKIIKNVNIYAEGSVLIEVWNTKVICTASVSDKVPSFLRGTGKGWVTAEYSMLPRATNERNPREASKGKLAGRTVEIQRLIGRALRASIDLEKTSQKAIEQIIEKKYNTTLKDRGIKDITLVGIAFFGKLVKISYK